MMHNRLYKQPFYNPVSLKYQHLICGMFSRHKAIFTRYVNGGINVPDICHKSLPVGSLTHKTSTPNKMFVRCDACRLAGGQNKASSLSMERENLTLNGIHRTETRGPGLMAKWYSGKRYAACHEKWSK
jgi:hypothetical protein